MNIKKRIFFGGALSHALLNPLSKPISHVVGKGGASGHGRYNHAIILSFIVPFIMLIAVITASGRLLFSIEEARHDAILAISDWNKLHLSTRLRFCFHEKQTSRADWLADMDALERTLAGLRESKGWILGESAATRVDKAYNVWLAARRELMKGDELFERARATEMGKKLSGMSYAALVRSAFTRRPGETFGEKFGEKQLGLLYLSRGNMSNLVVSGDALGRSLQEASDDIAARTRYLWRLTGAVALAASAAIVLLAFFSVASFTRTMSVARDITQRERNEEALMHQSKMRIETEKALLSEKRLLDEYINSLPGLFYVFDEKRFVRWNREWKRVTGYSDEELSVRYGPDFFEGEDRTRIEERMLSVFHDGYAEIDTELVTKNGRKIPYHFNGIRKKLNGKDHLVGLAMDITDRKRAEENLKKARAYISNIIDSMPSMLIGVDADGRVTQWNSEARRATGVSQEEAVGRPLAAAIPRLADEMDRVHEAMRGREAQIDPRKARQEGGGTRYEDITVYPLIANGAEGAVIRVDDVTDKVRMEEMMIQGEKMLSVGGLAAGMAHEINNPLAGMMQTAGVLANRLTREDMPANRKASEAAGVTMESIRSYMTARGAPRMIAAINESGRRVADIVNNILSFARKSDDRTSSHDLAELLDKTLALAGADYDLKKRYDFKRIEIIKDYDDNAPPAPCESPKIQQVLFNILRNGAQAMQEAEVQKPRFIVRTRVEKERCMVRVEIEDNGPGMEEAIRKRVFEPFYTTKPVGVGAGLGLSVSYFIITENHGGEMTVESAPGKGARFIVRIPTGRRNQLPGI